jgi:hypothetical protein
MDISSYPRYSQVGPSPVTVTRTSVVPVGTVINRRCRPRPAATCEVSAEWIVKCGVRLRKRLHSEHAQRHIVWQSERGKQLLDLGGGPARVASRPLWPAFNTTDPLVATTLDLLPAHQDIAVSFPIRLQHLAVEHQPYFGGRWISRQAPASEYSPANVAEPTRSSPIHRTWQSIHGGGCWTPSSTRDAPNRPRAVDQNGDAGVPRQ